MYDVLCFHDKFNCHKKLCKYQQTVENERLNFLNRFSIDRFNTIGIY